MNSSTPMRKRDAAAYAAVYAPLWVPLLIVLVLLLRWTVRWLLSHRQYIVYAIRFVLAKVRRIARAAWDERNRRLFGT